MGDREREEVGERETLVIAAEIGKAAQWTGREVMGDVRK